MKTAAVRIYCDCQLTSLELESKVMKLDETPEGLAEIDISYTRSASEHEVAVTVDFTSTESCAL